MVTALIAWLFLLCCILALMYLMARARAFAHKTLHAREVKAHAATIEEYEKQLSGIATVLEAHHITIWINGRKLEPCKGCDDCDTKQKADPDWPEILEKKS